jgi:hypothetical protein
VRRVRASPSAVSRALVAEAISPAASSAAPRNVAGLDPEERTAALVRELDRAPAVSERPREISPQPHHLAQESARSVEGLKPLFVGEERLQPGLSFGRTS